MRPLFAVLSVIFSLSFNAYANNDPFGMVDLNAPLNYQIANASNPEVYVTNRVDLKNRRLELAQDSVWNSLHISNFTKVTLTLSDMSPNARDPFFARVRICHKGTNALCLSRSENSVEFNGTDVGISILDYKFSNFSEQNWMALAELLNTEQVWMAVTVYKKTQFYKSNEIQGVFYLSLQDLIQKQNAEITIPQLSLKIQLKARELHK